MSLERIVREKVRLMVAFWEARSMICSCYEKRNSYGPWIGMNGEPYHGENLLF